MRIAVSPALRERHGAEVYWTWRLLLNAGGWGWCEVDPGDPCDVAHVIDAAEAPQARLCITADPAAWAQPDARRLAAVTTIDGLTHPVFIGDPLPARGVADGARFICPRDVVFDAFWFLTGQEERHWPRDRHGIFDLTGTAMLGEQVLTRAPASAIATWLRQTLIDRGLPAPPPPWPRGKRAAAAVSHDVDHPLVHRWVEPLRILRRRGRRGFGAALSVLTGQRNYWGFPFWTALEERLGIRSAFYFVARHGSLLQYATGVPDPFYDVAAPDFRQLLGTLVSAGYEIGLHASYLAYRSRAQLAAEKERLETLTGGPIDGGRHHYLHLDPADVEATLLLHEQVGLRYDASLYHDRYVGWRRGWSQPFFPFHQRERRALATLQMPTGWMDDQLFGNRRHNPGDRWDILRGLAERVAEQQGCLLIDVHEYVFDEAIFPDWAETYRRLWEYLRARGDFWFATPRELAAHWRTRAEQLAVASVGLDGPRR